MKLFQKKYWLLSLVVVLSLSACQPKQEELVENPKEQSAIHNITILHTNDHHGHFWHNDYGEYGLAAQKTLVDNIRKEVAEQGGTLLLLSGGDINTGVPESDLLNAEPDFKGMNLVGYDAMALGNHEFDNSIEILRTQEDWANFPFLSANIYDINTDQRLFKPYEIFEKDGVKIAVIGLTTDDTIRLANPENLENIEFKVPADEAKKIVEELRQNEKPDITIAVTHMGHYDDGKHGSNAPGDVEMARSLPKGYLDMIVGGHSQEPLCMSESKPNQKQENYIPGTACQPDQQNGTWIVQAHEWGKYVGRADFELKDGQLELKNYQLIPVNLSKKGTKDDGTEERIYYTEEIPHNAEMMALLTPFQEKGNEQLGIKIGSVDSKLIGDRNKVRFEQTNLAQMILAGMAERANADFAIISGGSVRDSIDAGDISYKDILKVQPFAAELVYVDLTGDEVMSYLEVAANMQEGSGAYAQFYNVTFARDDDGKLVDIKIGYENLDPIKTYRMATLNFNAVGGDGYPIITNHKNYMVTGFVDAEILKDYIEKNSPLSAQDYEPPKHMPSIKM